MKKQYQKIMAVLAMGLVLAAIGLTGWQYIRENCMIWDGRIYRLNTDTVDLSGKALPELTSLSEFPNLRRIDIRDTGADFPDYEALRTDYPDCEILWDVPFQGKYYDCRREKITLTTLTEEEIEILDYLPYLTSIDAWNCEDYAALGALQRRRPDCKVFYSVEIAGKELDCDISRVELENAPYEQLRQYVEYLPQVESIHLTGELPLARQLLALEDQFPDANLTWETEAFGRKLTKDTTFLALGPEDARSIEDLSYWLPYFPHLEQVDLLSCDLPQEELIRLVKDFPGIHFLFELTYDHVTVRTDAEEIDLSNVKFGTADAIENILPCFPNLKKVVACECDIPSEDMDALGKKYPHIRFVWSVMLGGQLFRTDAVYFTPNRTGMKVYDGNIEDLKYCVDMVCVDLGHQAVSHCDWAANMPNLKYLILADTRVSNIEGVRNLENLVFLELFQTYYLKDYSPLLTCKKLEDLNLCYSYGDYTPILEMTWLKRLWWDGAPWGASEKLREALPDTEYNDESGSSTGGTWRQGQHYYDMRNFIGMEIMFG